jgi:hypothetical protein
MGAGPALVLRVGGSKKPLKPHFKPMAQPGTESATWVSRQGGGHASSRAAHASAPPVFELAEACHEASLDCIASKEKFEDAIAE